MPAPGGWEIKRRYPLREKYNIMPFFLRLASSSTPPFRVGVFSSPISPPALFSVDCLTIRLPPRISVTLENSSFFLPKPLTCFNASNVLISFATTSASCVFFAMMKGGIPSFSHFLFSPLAKALITDPSRFAEGARCHYRKVRVSFHIQAKHSNRGAYHG